MTRTRLDGDLLVEDHGARWVLHGEIDAAVQARVERDLLDHLAALPASQRVVVDLTAVTFLDSSGLRLLYHAAAAGPVRPLLVGASESVRDLLDISGVADRFDHEA